MDEQALNFGKTVLVVQPAGGGDAIMLIAVDRLAHLRPIEHRWCGPGAVKELAAAVQDECGVGQARPAENLERLRNRGNARHDFARFAPREIERTQDFGIANTDIVGLEPLADDAQRNFDKAGAAGSPVRRPDGPPNRHQIGIDIGVPFRNFRREAGAGKRVLGLNVPADHLDRVRKRYIVCCHG